jgi:hypothetical protein
LIFHILNKSTTFIFQDYNTLGDGDDGDGGVGGGGGSGGGGGGGSAAVVCIYLQEIKMQ